MIKIAAARIIHDQEIPVLSMVLAKACNKVQCPFGFFKMCPMGSVHCDKVSQGDWMRFFAACPKFEFPTKEVEQ